MRARLRKAFHQELVRHFAPIGPLPPRSVGSSEARALMAPRRPAATSAQVEKLQAQIEQMGKELEEMKQLVKGAELPAQQRQTMNRTWGEWRVTCRV